MAKKKEDNKPVVLKEVTITAKKPMKKQTVKPDSTEVGYGAGKRKFANKDIKEAVKAKQLNGVDTTSRNSISSTAKGNSDKADNIAQITVAAAQAKKLEAEADNLKADKVVKEQQILKLGEEAEKAKQETVKIKGETALQGWAQRQLTTITDSELNSYSKGQGWTKGWSEGSSQGTSSGKSEQGGASLGANVGVTVLGTGGNVGANAAGNYGYSKF